MSKPRSATRPKAIDVGLDAKVPYVALDPTPGGSNLGRAEFQFCPLWKNGRMSDLLIFPKQQRVDVDCYRLKLAGRKITVFSFQGVPYPTERPHCWRMGWCPEHQTVSYEVYVPSGTKAITFRTYFGNSLEICFEGLNREDL